MLNWNKNGYFSPTSLSDSTQTVVGTSRCINFYGPRNFAKVPSWWNWTSWCGKPPLHAKIIRHLAGSDVLQFRKQKTVSRSQSWAAWCLLRDSGTNAVYLSSRSHAHFCHCSQALASSKPLMLWQSNVLILPLHTHTHALTEQNTTGEKTFSQIKFVVTPWDRVLRR
jgi:hypothetical protein